VLKLTLSIKLAIIKIEMKHWNKTGKIKSIIILIFILLSSISIINFNENIELRNDFYIGISTFSSIIIILFIPLLTKFWSLFGIKFKEPNWNENPLSLNFSRNLILFQFIGYCFIFTGIIKVLFIVLFYQTFHGESVFIFSSGVSIIIGIKLSVKWMSKSYNKKKKSLPRI
tara:strand:- start:1221 stop:1733 length:513 start_codon:yes stop_codon:yes gene_type:complete